MMDTCSLQIHCFFIHFCLSVASGIKLVYNMSKRFELFYCEIKVLNMTYSYTELSGYFQKQENIMGSYLVLSTFTVPQSLWGCFHTRFVKANLSKLCAFPCRSEPDVNVPNKLRPSQAVVQIQFVSSPLCGFTCWRIVNLSQARRTRMMWMQRLLISLSARVVVHLNWTEFGSLKG